MSDVIALCADPAERARPIKIQSASIAPGRPDPTLLEIDPRPCGECGLTADRHKMVDDGDGPIFYCVNLDPDEMTLPELEHRAELRHREDVAAIIARLEAMDDPSQRQAPQGERKPRPYQPADATIDAFKFLVCLGDEARLAKWLRGHQSDAPHLLKIFDKGK